MPAPVSSDAKFCTDWQSAYRSLDEAKLSEVLRHPPAAIADAVAVIRENPGSGDEAKAGVAYSAVLAWIEINCETAATTRHVAPPADADFQGLTLCSAATPPAFLFGNASDEHAVIYGEADRAEPYNGPMIGVFSTKTGDGGYLGDGDQTTIRVRGKVGHAAPISVFQQAILPELGTVIGWKEDGYEVGLYGRFWSEEQTDKLIAVADGLELVDGHFELPAAARPAGYRQVYAGPLYPSLSIVTAMMVGDYNVRYQSPPTSKAPLVGGILTVTGQTMSAEQFDGFRFFALALTRAHVGDRDMLFGSLWSKTGGPYVATWREADGFTVRITGLGVSEAQVRAVAEQSHELDRDQWSKLVTAAVACKT